MSACTISDLSAGLEDGALRLLGAGRVADVIHDDPDAFAAQPLGNALPDALARSSHDCNLTRQSLH